VNYINSKGSAFFQHSNPCPVCDSQKEVLVHMLGRLLPCQRYLAAILGFYPD